MNKYRFIGAVKPEWTYRWRIRPRFRNLGFWLATAFANPAATTPVESATEIPIDAPLDAPNVHEAVVFLRSGPEGLKRDLVLVRRGFEDDVPVRHVALFEDAVSTARGMRNPAFGMGNRCRRF